MDRLTLEQWGIVYGTILSTGAVLWHAINLWRARHRLRIWGGIAYIESVDPLGDGYYERWYVAIFIRNCGPRENVAEMWHIDKTKGEGPVVVMQDGLPAKLDGYAKTEIKIWEPEVLAEREPRVVYVEDARGKRYKAKRKHVREIVEAAKYAVDKNKQRSKEPPESMRKAQEQAGHVAGRTTSLFQAVDPSVPTIETFGSQGTRPSPPVSEQKESEAGESRAD